MRRKKFRMPWHLLALDLVGAVLVAVGLLAYISEGDGIVLIVAGIALMVPLVLHLLRISKPSGGVHSDGEDNKRGRDG